MTRTMVGPHRTNGPIRAKRSGLRLLRRPILTVVETPDQAVAGTFDEFGQLIHRFAYMLTGDSELAEQLAIQAILAHEPEPSTLQELSAGVYAAWIGRGTPVSPRETAAPLQSWANEPLVDQIHALPTDQRAALGLCKFGGHSYRGAAEVLGLAPERVARLLGDALRILGPVPEPAA